MARVRPAPGPFGQQLRHWRARAGLSQLDLAAEAGTSARHLSFLETGRSRPGRELVLRLAAALDLPARQSNTLLAAAGLPAAFPLRALDEAPMRPVTQVLERVLAGHEPYPAWIMGRGLRFLKANRPAEALIPGLCALTPEQVADLWFGPGPLRDQIENWQDVVRAGVTALRREALRSGDTDVAAALRRVEGHARGIPPVAETSGDDFPVVCPRFRIGGRTVRTLTTVMRFDSAVEVTASELRVELMFPADEESAAFFHELAGSGTSSPRAGVRRS